MRGLVRLPILLLLLVVLGGVAERTRKEVDLTAERSLTLSAQSLRIARQIDEPVRITAFLPKSDPGRSDTAALLGRYRRVNPKIRPRIVDPDASPGEVRRLGVDPILGGMTLEQGDAIERAPATSEQDITAGLARLLRGTTATVCFTTGHGEGDTANDLDDGLSAAAKLLRDNGYTIKPVDLLTQTTIPADCRALVMVNPTAPLGDAERPLADALAAGGRLLILTDPASTVDVSALTRPYGLAIERGLAFEASPDNRMPGDPLSVVVTRYRTPSPIARRLPPTVFPGAQAIRTTSDEGAGLSAVGVVDSSDDSYLERKPAQPSIDPEDLLGPLHLVAAADRSSGQDGTVVRSRVVMAGDADFPLNAFIGQAGNGALLLQSLDWLTLDEDLVSVSVNLPAVRPLQLTEGRVNYARLLSAVIIPGLFLAMGAFVWALRRPR